MRPPSVNPNGISKSERLFSSSRSSTSLKFGTAAFAVGICLLGNACSETVSPTPDAVGKVFVLVSVNGAELPHRFWADGHLANELVADTLVFRDADSVAYYRTTRWVTGDDQRLSSNTHAKAYEQLSSGSILITQECPMAASWCRADYEERGVFRGDSLITSNDNPFISEDRVYLLVSRDGYP